MPTPASSRLTRALSPPLSSSPSFTAGQQQKLNVVTRLAIEGKAKQGAEGVGIKMYLKVCMKCVIECEEYGSSSKNCSNPDFVATRECNTRVNHSVISW